MASFLRMRGAHAAVYYGYHVAAQLGPWSLEFGVIHARIVSSNAYRLTQSPLWFTIDNSAAGRPDFKRRLLNVTVNGDVLTGRLAPKA